MKLSKRHFLQLGGAVVGTAAIKSSLAASPPATSKSVSEEELEDITGGIKPISAEERQQRIAKIQSLMRRNAVAAVILEPGAAMDYFSGVQWWRSERVTALVIPREGEVGVVCPFFEEPSIRESMSVSGDVRVWQEHESPFTRIGQLLADRGISKGKLGFESSVRYFVQQGVMAELPGMQDVSAEPLTRACRMFKSQHELRLMHKANEITLRAYRHVWKKLDIGMSQADVKQLMQGAQAALGGSTIWNMALFNEASAYPHGTRQQLTMAEGSLVLMDCGCSVQGYQSDISRTFVLGEPSKRQQQVWQTVRKGQQIAFEHAQPGVSAGAVDDAVRQYYESLGYGPGYQTPGLSHRTGHGIGMEGHESVNFVRGEQTLLQPGMCFSNEPGLYIYGEFGVRLEDCLYMTDKGPRWFTEPPVSLAEPIGRVAVI